LRAFKLGDKLLRIPMEAVEDFEKCETTAPSGIEADGPPNGTKAEGDTGSLSVSPNGTPFRWQSKSSGRHTTPATSRRS
jgi:hypothetical protein